MKKFICFMMAAIIFLLSPFSAYASTTESMIIYESQLDNYSIMPLTIYDQENFNLETSFELVDESLSHTIRNFGSSRNIVVPSNLRFNGSSDTSRNYFDFTELTSSQLAYQAVYRTTITPIDDDVFSFMFSGADIQIYGVRYFARVYDDETSFNKQFLKSDINNIRLSWYDADGNRLGYSYPNLNNVSQNSSYYYDMKFEIPTTSLTDVSSVGSIRIDVYFDIPDDIKNYNHINFGFGFFATDSFLSGNMLFSGSSNSTSDYQQNVEGELNNIQTGIDNVINSVVQMGNQAWQGAQQTVQAVTQMTEQLNSAIDQQRQDILEGLGLLGDDLDNSLNNVKTEITNIGSSITNKLESTTESITNKIESTTETITNTIETKVDEVTTAVDNVKESVTEVKNSILDLPNKIKDMLLGLIVPDAETMSSKFSEFSGLLEQKLGVIYQIPMMLFDFFDTIVNAATTPQTALTLPAFQLPWIDGSTLTVWQPMEYRIIPEGMQVLSDLIKTITSMTVVVLTFNSVKRAYERFLRS